MIKMVMAIVHRDETARVLEALIAAGHTATFNDSRGGVLRQASRTLLIAVQEEQLTEVLDIIRENCRSSVALDSTEDVTSEGHPKRTWTQVGGAVVMVWTVDLVDFY